MAYNSFYGLTFNPFDKQQLKEKDYFRSRDFNEMNVRLNHLSEEHPWYRWLDRYIFSYLKLCATFIENYWHSFQKEIFSIFNFCHFHQ